MQGNHTDMKHNTSIFSSARILLPAFHADPAAMAKWAVIACDQFTSAPSYWETCRKLIGAASSAYSYIMPEAYLGTDDETGHGAEIAENMKAFAANNMTALDGFVYLERTLPNGKIRHGIVGKLDLEAYDYNAGSESPIRATEATVLERIPPRCKIRSEATVELPHILVLVDDRIGLFNAAKEFAGEKLYDFDLMQGGGHATGYAVTGDQAQALEEKLGEYEASRSGLVYAMGDGNHSLAAAKAHWENVKKATGDMEHPARYALCEITALDDDSLEFEPIYRVVKNCDPDDLLTALEAVTEPGEGEQSVEVITAKSRENRRFSKPTHALTVGTLQNFIDDYLKSHPGAVCDYIHGEKSLESLAAEDGCVGFLFDGMDKAELFPYVEAHGTLPRKTFSMGEAESKRYYLECRAIVR